MATVFMQWLETSPKKYDLGIKLLTLDRLRMVEEAIVSRYIEPGMRILEIGCGTGTLALKMAQKGALVEGVDINAAMLSEARDKVAARGLEESVHLSRLDAAEIGDRFPAASFDLVIATLVLSELDVNQQIYLLEQSKKLLKPHGRILIADEVVPEKTLSRLLFYIIRLPMALLTWILTRTSTSPLRDPKTIFKEAWFNTRQVYATLFGSLVLFEFSHEPEKSHETTTHAMHVPKLNHRISWRTLLIDLWELFFRIIPPYPKFKTGLYTIGDPGPESPVLVTGNFNLTVRRLVRATDGRVDAWLLVADSAGINVWCGAGGGYFTAEKVIAVLKASNLEEVVNHRSLILPQLCANGVDGWQIRRETGWGVHWGPVRANDIPDYLGGHQKKSDEMRRVHFPFKDRMEMVTVTMGFYGLLILLPVLIFWRSMFLPLAASLVGLSYFYAAVHPWLPGRDGLEKSIPLCAIAIIGMLIFSLLWGHLPNQSMFNWTIGLIALSVFSAAELQGMSPLMRGEQANWGWEAMIAAFLGLVYWLVPHLLGWR